MKELAILILFLVTKTTIYSMSCYKIKMGEELREYVQSSGLDIVFDAQQLKTNGASIYELMNGEIVMIPFIYENDLEGFVFKNKECFQEMIETDSFPLENEEETLFDTETKRFLDLPNSIPFYQNHLNELFGFDFEGIDNEKLDTYFNKLRKIPKRKVKDLDHTAMGMMYGWLLHQKTGGKWMLEKRYGTYNPYYVPIVTYEGRMVYVFDKYITHLEHRFKDILTLVKDVWIKSPNKKALEVALSVDYGYEKHIFLEEEG